MGLTKLYLALLLLAMVLPPFGVANGQGGRISAHEAGELARRQTGGRVLAVKPADGGYRVKVLTPSGEVRYVFIPDR